MKKITVFFLCFLTVLATLVGCGGPKQPEKTDPFGGRLQLTDAGSACITVVYDESIDGIAMPVRLFCEDLAEKTTTDVTFPCCGSGQIAQIDRDMPVIVFGYVEGISPADLQVTMRRLDRSIDVRDNLISLLAATKGNYTMLGEYILGLVVNENGELYLNTSSLACYQPGNYEIGTLKVCGVPVETCSIVCNDASRDAALELQNLIDKSAGWTLPLREDTEPADGTELIVGKTARNTGDAVAPGGFRIYKSGSSVVFAANDPIGFDMMTITVGDTLSKCGGKDYNLEDLSMEYQVPQRSIMTFNVQNVWSGTAGSRGSKTAEQILALAPDFVCLQEYDSLYRKSLTGIVKLLSDRYAEALPAGVDELVIWNPILYNKDKYTLLDCGYTDMYGANTGCVEYLTYSDKSVGGRSHFRTPMWSLLQDKADQSLYLVCNIHYSVIGNNGVESHLSESAFVMRYIGEQAKKYPTATVLVCGDYNSRIGTDYGGCTQMLNGGYTDTYDLARVKKCGQTYHDPGKEPVGKTYADAIDHILTLSPDLKVESYMMVCTEEILPLSDHCPVVMKFN